MNILQKISLGALALPSLQMMAHDRPNIVLIMTDQQSYNTISALSDGNDGCYFQTPNIDRIAKDGLAFTRTYCANPVSGPSRFAMFTGKYGGQYGVRCNKCDEADEAKSRAMIAENGMGNVFARGGYDTYYGGKVHLPFSGKKGRNAFSAPVTYGFENYYTNDERDVLGQEAASIIDQKGALAQKGELDKPFLLVASFLNPHDICLEGSTGLSPIVEDKGGRKQPITECVRMMRDRAAAIDSVEFYSSHAPQMPYNFDRTADVPNFRKATYKDFPEYYWRKYRWTYGQLVSLVDSHIGDILDAIDRNPELKDNTIIIFTADHGEMQGAHNMVTKGVPYDECQRVPFIVSGPGVPKGERDNTLICNGTDLLPTMCGLAKIEAPVTDGYSVASHITDGDRAEVHDALYLEGESFVCMIEGNMKYTDFDWKNEGEMLVDLNADRGEMLNILDSNEDIASDMKGKFPSISLNASSTSSNKAGKKAGKSKDGKKKGKEGRKGAGKRKK